MKRFLLAALVWCGFFAVATSVSAYSVNLGGSIVDVGNADILYSSDYNPYDVQPSNPAHEAAWLNLVFGTSLTGNDIAKYDPPTILTTREDSNVVAIQFTKMLNPEFFYVKTGRGQDSYNHYLFENFVDLGWGVIDLDDAGIRHGISHVGSIGGAPVPEPATIVLLGAGLIGLAAYGRKRS